MANNIKKIRTSKGFSQEKLAEAISTSKVQISRLERGDRQLTQSWMGRIASALGVAPSELLPDDFIGTVSQDTSSPPPSIKMRVAFLQALHEEGILLPGEELNSLINEIDTYSSSESDTLKLGMKLGELVTRAKSLPTKKLSDLDLNALAKEALEETLTEEGLIMPDDKKEEAIKLGIKIYLADTEEVKAKKAIKDALNKAS